MVKILKKIWQGWKKLANKIGKVNSVIVLTIFYFLIIGPVAIIIKIYKLFKSKKKSESYWRDYQSVSGDDFTKQF